MKLLYNYYWKVTIQKTVLFTVAIFVFFSLIDFTFHPWIYQSNNWMNIILFAFVQFSRKAFILIPFCFLISLLFVFIKAANHKEFTALLTSGISKKAIAKAFYLAAACIAMVLLINDSILLPAARKKLVKLKHHSLPIKPINRIDLEANITLIFKKIKSSSRLMDVYIIDHSNLYHAKYLDLKPTGALAHFIDTFSYEDNMLKKMQTTRNKQFDQIKLSHLPSFMHGKWIDYSISQLLNLALKKYLSFSTLNTLRANLLFKLTMILSPFLIVFYLFTQKRMLQRFVSSAKILSLSTIGFMAGYLLLQFCSILMEGNLLSWKWFLLILIALIAPIQTIVQSFRSILLPSPKLIALQKHKPLQ